MPVKKKIPAKVKIKTYQHNVRKKKAKAKLRKAFFNEDGTRVETGIEKKVRLILEKMGVAFKQEFFIEYKPKKWKCYDFLISDGEAYTILVECDGGYFHAGIHETKAKEDLNFMQRKNLKNDKLKDRIAKKKGIPLIRFLEKDINSNPKLIREVIEEEIKKQIKA